MISDSWHWILHRAPALTLPFNSIWREHELPSLSCTILFCSPPSTLLLSGPPCRQHPHCFCPITARQCTPATFISLQHCIAHHLAHSSQSCSYALPPVPFSSLTMPLSSTPHCVARTVVSNPFQPFHHSTTPKWRVFSIFSIHAAS